MNQDKLVSNSAAALKRVVRSVGPFGQSEIFTEEQVVNMVKEVYLANRDMRLAEGEMFRDILGKKYRKIFIYGVAGVFIFLVIFTLFHCKLFHFFCTQEIF